MLDAPKEESPVRRRFLTNDATVEKLGVILSDNPAGVMVFRDELIGFVNNLEKDNQQGARAFYLEAWDGTGRFTYDRISRGTIEIETAVVSVFGGIQPGRLGPYVREAVNGGMGDDGFMQRFQLVVWPDVPGTWRNVDRWPNSEARQCVFALLERLQKVDAASVGAKVDQYDQAAIPFLQFDEPAQQAFDAWREQLEHRLRSGDEHPAIEAHLGKYRSLVPSLALIFHLADHEQGPVGLPALLLAIRWVVYLESHARRVYAAATAAEMTAAKAIWRRVQRNDLPDQFDARDIYRKGWAGLNDSDEVKQALEMLADHGYLIEIQQQGSGPQGGRIPLPKYAANSRAIAGNPTDKTDKSGSVSFVSTHGGGFQENGEEVGEL